MGKKYATSSRTLANRVRRDFVEGFIVSTYREPIDDGWKNRQAI